MPEPTKARAELPSPIELAERLDKLEATLDEKLDGIEERLTNLMYERVDNDVAGAAEDMQRQFQDTVTATLRDWKVAVVTDLRAEIDARVGGGPQPEEAQVGGAALRAEQLYQYVVQGVNTPNNFWDGGNNR